MILPIVNKKSDVRPCVVHDAHKPIVKFMEQKCFYVHYATGTDTAGLF